jgi:hypothetical protein
MVVTETKTCKIRRLTMQRKIGKENWVAMFREVGLSDYARMKWHRLFETRHPEGHEDFLNWLGIPSDFAWQ